MSAIFVYPVPWHLRGSLLSKPRLYAYPHPPEDHIGKLVILDSGAFALSKRGDRIDERHMAKLAKHYLKHCADNKPPVVGVAPDVYLDPFRTLQNWYCWHQKYAVPVAPVVQFSEAGRINLNVVRMQSEVYAARRAPFWCVSNPGLNGEQARTLGIEDVFIMLKREFGAQWIHCLGAGWNGHDVRTWSEMDGLDSFDSIAHYTEPGWYDASRDAEEGQCSTMN